MKIRGYAATFGSLALVNGGEHETIAPGAFAEMLDLALPVALTFDSHDPNAPMIAHTDDGTLELFADDFGLGFQATLDADDNNLWPILSAIVKGGFDRASVNFSDFELIGETEIHGVQARCIEKATIDHIAIVANACYRDTVVWRADVPIDDAPWRIRSTAEKWELGWADARTTPPALPKTRKRPLLSGDALVAETRLRLSLKDYPTGNPHLAMPLHGQRSKKPTDQPSGTFRTINDLFKLVLEREKKLRARVEILERQLQQRDHG